LIGCPWAFAFNGYVLPFLLSVTNWQSLWLFEAFKKSITFWKKKFKTELPPSSVSVGFCKDCRYRDSVTLMASCFNWEEDFPNPQSSQVFSLTVLLMPYYLLSSSVIYVDIYLFIYLLSYILRTSLHMLPRLVSNLWIHPSSAFEAAVTADVLPSLYLGSFCIFF
jgi:hypothetical protein